MTARHPRAALLLAAVPATALAAIAVLRASDLKLHADRHCIELTPRPRRSCPDCQGEGGWWTGGPFPEMEACGCWSDRRGLRVRLQPLPAWPDEPPF